MTQASVFVALTLATACLQLAGCDQLVRNFEEGYKEGFYGPQLGRCHADGVMSHPLRTIDDCTAAIAVKPDDAESYYLRAVTRGEMGYLKPALADLNKTLALRPLPTVFAERCRIFAALQGNRSRDARLDCEEALRAGPRDINVRYQHAEFLMALGEERGALTDALALEHAAPQLSYGYQLACSVYLNEKKYTAAARVCDRATHLGDPVYAYFDEAELHAELGDWKRARAYADAAVRAGATLPESYMGRCWLFVQMNDLADAKPDCAMASWLADQAPYTRDASTVIADANRAYAEMYNDEKLVAGAFPHYGSAFAGECYAEDKLGRSRAALASCDRAIAEDPTDAGGYIARANVYRSLHEYAQAVADYQTALHKAGYAWDALCEEANLELQRGNAARALELAIEYRAKNPYNPNGQEVYARALAASGQMAQARVAAQAAKTGYRQRGDNIGVKETDALIAAETK